MSSNCRTEETPIYFDFKNSAYYNAEETFTDIQSCVLSNDTDSQSSYADLSDVDDNERRGAIHFSSLKNDDVIKPNEDFNKSKNKNQEKTTVNLPESSNDIVDLIREDLYKFVFMPIPKHLSNYVRCRLIRSKSGLVQTFRLEVEYEDDEKSLCVLTAEKQLRIFGQTRYTISVVPKFTDDYYSAELQSNNTMGTGYVLSQLNGDERQQLAVIFYETNFLDLTGVRKIEVLLPKMEDLIDGNDIVEDYSKKQNNCFIRLHNKPPNWNPHTSSYSLVFDGKNRITLDSIKNFQMVIENEEYIERIVMQFGRMSDNEFSCDFRYPLSLIQTFGIALSAFESLSRFTV